MESTDQSLSDPSPMYKTASDNIQTTSVINFSTVNSVTLNQGTTTMDLNKFLMTGNTYDENYTGVKKPIVYIRNVRSVEMTSEIYQNNNGIFREAQKTYGNIETTDTYEIESDNPGAFSFSTYYLVNGIQQVDSATRSHFYPGPPIVIDGALKIDLTSMTFDNNYKQEQIVNDPTNEVPEPSQAITFVR